MPNRDEQRASFIAAVSAGKSLREACREFGVPPGTGHRWWSAYRPVAGGTDGTQTQNPSFEDRLSELLDASLGTMLAQVKYMAEPAWLKEQNARDLGVAYGIVTDKAARLAGLIERARSGRPDEPGDDLDGPAPPTGLPDGPRD